MKGKDYDPKALYNAVLKAGINEHLLLAYMELEKEYKSTLISALMLSIVVRYVPCFRSKV